MSILINESTKVICQGFTGGQATQHCIQCIDYGTQLVGGVTPRCHSSYKLCSVVNALDTVLSSLSSSKSLTYNLSAFINKNTHVISPFDAFTAKLAASSKFDAGIIFSSHSSSIFNPF